MRNYHQPGAVITATAPTALVAGQGVLIGDLFCVAVSNVAAGAQAEFIIEGVVDQPKAPAVAINEGVRVFWDDTAKNVTTTSTGNRVIGWAIGPGNYAAGATVIKVKLGRPNAVGA